MARGMRDWGMYSPTEAIQKGLDISELATRLGSVVGFDRSGTALFIDDCSSGLTKWKVVEGTGELVRAQYGYNIFGGYSIRLEDDGLDTSRPLIYTGLPLYKNVIAGYEIIGNLYQSKTFLSPVVWIMDGANSFAFKLRMLNNAGKLYIEDNDLGWVEIGSFNKLSSGANWTFFLKMFMDFKTRKYQKIRLNNNWYDVSNYKAKEDIWAVNELIELDVMAGYEEDSSTGGVNLNGIIFTINE